MPPERDKYGKQVAANADGSLRFEVYRIPQDETPIEFVVNVVDVYKLIRCTGTLTNNLIEEKIEEGEKVFYLKLDGAGLKPGAAYYAQRQARQSGDPHHLSYQEYHFRIPDTSFAKGPGSQFSAATE